MKSRPRPLIIHNQGGLGAKRLLEQPRDLPLGNVAEMPLEASPPQYHALFQSYIDDLEWAADIAVEWWNNLVRVSMERDTLTEMEAMRAQYRQRPAGPASRPEIVFVVREYWLKVIALNEANVGQTGVTPQSLLLAWLQDNGHLHLYDILTGMPYWPIGLDSQGRWC